MTSLKRVKTGVSRSPLLSLMLNMGFLSSLKPQLQGEIASEIGALFLNEEGTNSPPVQRARCHNCQVLTKFFHVLLCVPVCSVCINGEEFRLCSHQFCIDYLGLTAGDLATQKSFKCLSQIEFGNPKCTPKILYLLSDIKKVLLNKGLTMEHVFYTNMKKELAGYVFKIGMEVVETRRGLCRADVANLNAKGLLTHLGKLKNFPKVYVSELEALFRLGGLFRNEFNENDRQMLINEGLNTETADAWLNHVKNSRGELASDGRVLEKVVYVSNKVVNVSLGGSDVTRRGFVQKLRGMQRNRVGRGDKILITCVECEEAKGNDAYVANNWKYNIRVCKACTKAIAESNKNGQSLVCSGCSREKKRDEFTSNQWKNRNHRRAECIDCQIAKKQGANVPCRECKATGRECFDEYTWGNRFRAQPICTACKQRSINKGEMEESQDKDLVESEYDDLVASQYKELEESQNKEVEDSQKMELVESQSVDLMTSRRIDLFARDDDDMLMKSSENPPMKILARVEEDCEIEDSQTNDEYFEEDDAYRFPSAEETQSFHSNEEDDKAEINE